MAARRSGNRRTHRRRDHFFRFTLPWSGHHHRLHGSGCSRRRKDFRAPELGEIALRAFHQRLRRINRTRRSAGSTCRDGCVAGGTFAPLDNAAATIACRMRRGGGNRFRIQRANLRLGVCRRDRARFHGDGNFRSACVCVRSCHADGARVPRAGAAVSNPVVPAQWQLGDHSISVARFGLRSGCAVVHPAAASKRKMGRTNFGAGLPENVRRRSNCRRAGCVLSAGLRQWLQRG